MKYTIAKLYCLLNIQCAARISRHRAISQFAPISLFSWLQESWFLSAKSSNFRSFLRPGLSFFGIGRSFWRLGGLYGRFLGWLCDFIEKSAFADLPPRCPWTYFLRSREVFFFWVFLFLEFCDFECPETPFWLPFWLLLGSPGPLEKQLKVCKSWQFQRFYPFGTRSFPRSWSWVRF